MPTEKKPDRIWCPHCDTTAFKDVRIYPDHIEMDCLSCYRPVTIHFPRGHT